MPAVCLATHRVVVVGMLAFASGMWCRLCQAQAPAPAVVLKPARVTEDFGRQRRRECTACFMVFVLTVKTGRCPLRGSILGGNRQT